MKIAVVLYDLRVSGTSVSLFSDMLKAVAEVEELIKDNWKGEIYRLVRGYKSEFTCGEERITIEMMEVK